MRTIFCLMLIISLPLFSQQPKADPALFDFWIGEWDLTWKDPNGSIGTGTNIVTRILDGKVIQENFTGLTGQNKGYKGQSVSVLDGPSGEWKQTWVDNQNAFLPFTGGADGANRYFLNEFTKNGVHTMGKMVFRNITRDAFVWDWMKSTDAGTTWKTEWSINYKRKQ